MHRGRGAGRSAAPAHLDVPWSGGSFAPLLFPIDAAAAGARRPRAAGASSVEARIR
jgi:hypothetical protein